MSEAPHTRPRRARVLLTLARALLPIAVAAAILVVLPPLWFEDSPYTTGLAVEALVFGCYAVGFNLIFGSTNQLFLCVGALAGVGGYATAILSDKASLPLAVGVAIGTVSAAIVGGVLSWIAVRRSLNVIFTGIVTLVFSLAFTNFIIGQRDLTGADTGYVLQGAATDLADDRIGGYYLFVALLVGLLIVFRVLQLSHVGWAFKALRDDEVAAELAGVDVARYRIYAAVVGSAMIGLTGGLFAYSLGFISGAAAFGVLDRALTDSGQLREAYYGAFVIAIFLFLRRGVIPFVLGLFDRLAALRRRSQRMEGATPGRAER